jgi:hypothetical protein
MLHLGGKGGPEVGTEHLQGLSREAAHEIYAYIVYARFTADMNSLKGLRRSVTAMQETQHLIIEGLNSHTDAIHTQSTQRGDELRCYVIGITLYGEFLKAFKADDRVYGRDYPTKLLRSETRRCTASEIDCGDGCIGQV